MTGPPNQLVEISTTTRRGTCRYPRRMTGPMPYPRPGVGAAPPSTTPRFKLDRHGWAGIFQRAYPWHGRQFGKAHPCRPISDGEGDHGVDASHVPETSLPGRVVAAPIASPTRTVCEADRQRFVASGFHHFTIGTHDEFLHLNGSRRLRLPAGQWRVRTVSDVTSRRAFADGYVREFANSQSAGRPRRAKYQVQQFGLMLQGSGGRRLLGSRSPPA
mgnify:CR=1 FL=1